MSVLVAPWRGSFTNKHLRDLRYQSFELRTARKAHRLGGVSHEQATSGEGLEALTESQIIKKCPSHQEMTKRRDHLEREQRLGKRIG